jgi:DnaJ-class molecular chaperone
MNNSMWQACPVCNGQGNNLLGRPCHVCNGHGIISTISGLPPVHRKYNATTSSTTMTYSDRDEKRMDIIGQNGNEGLHYEQSYCGLHGVLMDDDNQCWICLEMSNK